MSFKVSYSRQAEKFLRKIPQGARIARKLRLNLSSFPTGDVKTLKGRGNSFRIRVGQYRALFVVYIDSKSIYVFKIGKRSNVY